MFIKRLEIYGFKSFPYKVSIPFSPGITGIVGPNGAGKSNILDAIRFVLGEQSPKKLRVRELGELIFAGDHGRKVEFAEVKLVINHSPPVWEKFKDLSEIVIIRRFYRTGEGEFYINQKPCRLKDIQYLFLELGISSQSYAIIDQGEVSKFLEMSPKERRVLIEDLAGVSSLKFTEEETRKNLIKTKENLVRIEDILGEVNQQYEKLKIQAEEARKYLALKEELKATSLKKILLQIKHAYEEKEKLERKKEEIERKKEELIKAIENLEDKQKGNYQKVISLEREKKELLEQGEELKDNLLKLENKLRNLFYQEREQFAKYEKLCLKENNEKEKIKGFELELKEISKRKEEIKEEAIKLQEKLSALQKKKGEIKESYETKFINFKEIEKSLFSIREEKNKLLERIKYLKEEKEELCKRLKLEEKRESLLEKELNDLKKEKKAWDEIIFRKNEELKKLKTQEKEVLKELEEKEKEYNSFQEKLRDISQEIKSLETRIQLIKKLLKSQKNKSFVKDLPSLGEMLNVSPQDLKLLEMCLGERLEAVVVKDLKEALEISSKTNQNITFAINIKEETFKIERIKEDLSFYKDLKTWPNHYIFFENEKLLLTPEGFAFLLKKEKEGFFFLKKELQELKKVFNSLSVERDKLYSILKGKEKEAHQTKKALSEIKKKIELISQEISKIQREKEKFFHSLIRVEEQLSSIKEKKQELFSKKEKIDAEYQSFEKKLNELKAAETQKQKEYERYLKERKTFEKELREIEIQINEILRKVTALQAEKESLKKRENYLKQEVEKAKNNLKNWSFEKDLLQNELNYVKEKIKELKKEKKTLEEKKAKLEENLAALEKKLSSFYKEKELIESKKRELEKTIGTLEKKAHHIEISIVEKKLLLENLEKELKELKEENANLKLKHTEESIEELEKKITLIKEELKNFTEVNLASIKEFEEVKNRRSFLLQQKEDIEKSIKDLEKILNDLKDLGRKKILEVLSAVNNKLKEIFPQIFKDGKAELTLQEGDPLSSGLEMWIHVPEKNIQSLNMLSGGEKALCVLALLISFYLVKPGPFCILDEVDAPLDEKNSLKFIKLLQTIKKNSQIILITHNPHIMKEVDTLLGVTMEEKGISKVVSLKIK